MNPNATEFQSLIYSQQGDEADPSNKSSGDAFQGIRFGLLVVYIGHGPMYSVQVQK